MANNTMGNGKKKGLTMGTARPMGVGPTQRPALRASAPKPSVVGPSAPAKKKILAKKPKGSVGGGVAGSRMPRAKGTSGGGISNSGTSMLPTKPTVARRSPF
jgi:hypothetical protein